VIAQTPASGSTGISTLSKVSATFGAEVQAHTLSFTLLNGATPVAASVSYDPATDTVTLIPAAALAAGTTYTANLSGAQDLYGNVMAGTSWSFTTAVANTTVPTVTAQSPASGATGIAITSPVTAAFSEEVQASTIGFTLKNGSTTVPASLSYNPATETATLTPSASLR
jgi:methionine-rich copper-binding protein CopC